MQLRKSPTDGDAGATDPASRKQMLREEKRLSSEVETDPSAQKLNRGGVLKRREEISAQGSDPSALQTRVARKVGSTQRKGPSPSSSDRQVGC